MHEKHNDEWNKIQQLRICEVGISYLRPCLLTSWGGMSREEVYRRCDVNVMARCVEFGLSQFYCHALDI